MKNYFELYRATHRLPAESPTISNNVSQKALTKLTKPIPIDSDEGSVSFVSSQKEAIEKFGSDKTQETVLPNITDDPEVAWRVEIMLPQIPDRGPIPFLVAREAVEARAGECASCGDPLGAGDAYVCGPCSRAKAIALELSMTPSSKIDNGHHD